MRAQVSRHSAWACFCTPKNFLDFAFMYWRIRRCLCGSDRIYYKTNDNIVEIMAIVGRQGLNHI